MPTTTTTARVWRRFDLKPAHTHTHEVRDCIQPEPRAFFSFLGCGVWNPVGHCDFPDPLKLERGVTAEQVFRATVCVFVGVAH